MKPRTILFYVDSAAMLAHCVSLAEVLREKLDARIVMMIVDSDRLRASVPRSFQVHDYALLFRSRAEISRAVGGEVSDASSRSPGPGRMPALIKARIRKLLQTVWHATGLSHASHVAGLSGALSARVSRLDKGAAVVHVWLLRALNDVARHLTPRRRRAFARATVAVGASAMAPLVLPMRVLGLLALPFYAIALAVDRLLRRRLGANIGGLRHQLQRFNYWLKAVRGVRRYVAAVGPNAIVLPEDNIETLSRAFVTYGRRCGAQSVVVPYTIPNPIEPALFYSEHADHKLDHWPARLVALAWPKWAFSHDGRRLLRLPAIRAAAIELMGLSSPAPWILNRGDAAAIALDSSAQRDMYLRLGFPSEQLAVVGDMNGMVLARRLAERRRYRADLLADLGLVDGRPLVVVAFPPDQYDGAAVGGFECATFEAMLDGWMAGLMALGQDANVVVRPHPRLDLGRLRRYQTPSLRFTLLPTVELVPLCDLYVACISATIRWAIACGIPVVNYDSYRYRYGDYLSARGVVHVEDAAAFRNVLQRFVADPVFADDLRHRQAEVKAHWGLVDDQCADRFARLVADLDGASAETADGVVHRRDAVTIGREDACDTQANR